MCNLRYQKCVTGIFSIYGCHLASMSSEAVNLIHNVVPFTAYGKTELTFFHAKWQYTLYTLYTSAEPSNDAYFVYISGISLEGEPSYCASK